eukprot:scaffold31388_cov75-Phaeocystis_antarctica.AAC.1
MGGELEWTGGVTPGRTFNTRQGLHSTIAVSTALYSSGNTGPLDLGSCRLPTPLTQSLSRDSASVVTRQIPQYTTR